MASKPRSPKSSRAPTRRKTSKPASRGGAGRAASGGRASAQSASHLIDRRIRELGGWRGETLARMRALIRKADPAIAEEWKWDVPVWSHDGIVCTGEAYAKVVKLTFARGASVPDPARLFNASLDGNTRRAIDIREGETIDARAFVAFVKTAVAANRMHARPAPALRKALRVEARKREKLPALLSGGNPRIAKADGDAPVQAYLAALPGWKRDVGRRLDALVTRTIPGVRKAVKWNSPFYGVEGQGWFLAMHAFTHYVKVTFFRGTSLRPAPAGGTGKEARWIDVHEDDLDEARLASWVKQAAKLPGWSPGRAG